MGPVWNRQVNPGILSLMHAANIQVCEMPEHSFFIFFSLSRWVISPKKKFFNYLPRRLFFQFAHAKLKWVKLNGQSVYCLLFMFKFVAYRRVLACDAMVTGDEPELPVTQEEMPNRQ